MATHAIRQWEAVMKVLSTTLHTDTIAFSPNQAKQHSLDAIESLHKLLEPLRNHPGAPRAVWKKTTAS
jgi:hypothetical protein